MEISLLKVLLNNISSFLRLSSYDNINLDPVQKYYQRTEEILKLLKPILDAIIDSKLASDEVLNKTFEDFSHSVDELRELFENWQPLLSKVYFVLQVESLISKIRASALDIFQLLKSSHQSLPDELSLTSLEHCSQKIKHIEHEHTSSLIKDAIRDQVDGIVPGSETLEKFVESLSLRSNQEIRIEAVALEKLKENAEQAEKAGEAEFMDQMIALVTRMHDRPVMIKQSQICSPVPITPGFCCPLSLELMKVLLNNISSFLHLSSYDNINLDPVQKYYQRTEEILKLLKPILDAIIDSKVASDEVLNKTFEDFSHSVDELRELFENWQPLLSRAYFVLQVESLISRIRASALDIFQLLKSSHQSLSDELSLTSLEHCLLKIKHIELEHTSSFIKDVIRDQVDGIMPGSETLVRIAESLSLRSNQEILIEAVALEKLKENAEQAEKAGEAEFMDQMIALVTRMHDRLVMIKQSQICSPVPIPPDFCCPLSLELMTDPVIVASGQTYERAFIKKWIDLGLTVCPKTRQTLAHTTLIPNYTVKALIANWCELNNVKLPDPMKIMSLNQPSPLLHGDSTPPRDSQVLPPSRGNQPTMPESIRSAGSPGKNLSATVNHREGSTPLHPRSASEVNLTGTAGNGQALDIARMSLTSSEGRYTNSEERSTELDGQHSVSPSRRASSTSADAVEESSQVHNRTASASTVLSNSSFSQGVVGDANETSEGPNYHTEASGEVKSEPQASGTVTTAPREPEFASRLLSRNHMIWRRPSERFVPRIVSNSSETRPDLSGIEAQVRKLIEDLNSTSVDAQREAVVELRLLAKHSMDNRMVIANCGAISLLVNMLHSKDTKIQENAVTALLNLSINDNNKTAIANAEAIGPLIHVLETGSPEAKENSAATLFSLSVIEDNKIRIGRSGAIGPLVDLLGNGTPRGKKDAATALFNLSIYHENKARIVQAGAVRHLVELMDPAAGMVDKAVAVLANLATIQEGRTAIGQENGIPVLVEVVELGSARGKENAAAALLQLCTNSNRFCNMVLQEGAVPPLVALSQSGTARAKEKAQALLSFFRNQRHGNAGRA